MGAPARFPSGVSTRPITANFGSYPMADPVRTGGNAGLGICHYTQDFTVTGAADYTVTGTSSGFAIAAGTTGGVAVLTPGASTTASAAYSNTFVGLKSGQRSWFAARFKVSAVSGNVAFYCGLRAGSSANDGLWFAKAAASTSVNVISTVSSSATTLATGVATAAADTWLNVGFYYDGTDLLIYVDDALVARAAAPTLTGAVLSPVFQLTPVNLETMTVDYIVASAEVAR